MFWYPTRAVRNRCVGFPIRLSVSTRCYQRGSFSSMQTTKNKALFRYRHNPNPEISSSRQFFVSSSCLRLILPTRRLHSYSPAMVRALPLSAAILAIQSSSSVHRNPLPRRYQTLLNSCILRLNLESSLVIYRRGSAKRTSKSINCDEPRIALSHILR